MTTSTLATNQDLVAAEVDGERTGLAASSFTSVSLDPSLVSFSVANTSKTRPDLRRAGHLGLTVLADHHGEVCRRLAGPVEHRFDDVAVTASDDGAVTLDEGLALFDCTIYDEVKAGDHTIVILQLHAVDHSDTSLPLVFHRSGFGRLPSPRRRPRTAGAAPPAPGRSGASAHSSVEGVPISSIVPVCSSPTGPESVG